MSMEEKQNSQTFLDFNQSVLKPITREQISEIIKESYKKSIPLEINGLNSKNKIGRNFQAEKTLDLSKYSGIIEYKPEELYIKVKAGTPIELIEKNLIKIINSFLLNQRTSGIYFLVKVILVQLVE